MPTKRPSLAALRAAAAALLGAAVVAAAYQLAWRSGWADLREAAHRRLQWLSADLASTLDKHDTLPLVLASHPDLVALVQQPTDPARTLAANRRLAELAAGTKVAAIYLVDARGMTLAASNWDKPGSYVGQNYAFRPYFRDAMAQGVGRFYAVGATTGEPGYFLAHRVVAGGGGVVVVKVSLDDIESHWTRSGELLMLADAHGVVFLSSRPEWRFHTLEPLAPEVRAAIVATQQYGNAPLPPLPLRRAGVAGDGLQLARLGPGGSPGTQRGPRVAVAQRAVDRMRWTVLSFSEIDDVLALARGYAAAAGFAYGFTLLTWLYIRLRRRRNAERVQARRALEQAHAELERRIDERTAALVSANDELAAKVAELDRTQAALRATQNELIQAGKLTVLGQMAASITHEINQPLAALRVLNDNTLVLLDRGDDDAVEANLQASAGPVQRIAAIVAELKGFARKDELQLQAVPVSAVIDAAVALVGGEARRDGFRIDRPPADPGLAALGQAVRIEQVLVNLLRNAMDASRDSGERRIDVQVQADEHTVSLSVADDGAGLSPEAQQRLFEPFFTTKPAGQGLGLGLAVSASIANALGGTLAAANRPEGGAIFTLRLPRALPADLASAAAPRTIG